MWRFLIFFNLFAQYRAQNAKLLVVSRHLQDFMKIFTDVSVEKQGKSEHIFVLEGGENAWGLLSKTFKL